MKVQVNILARELYLEFVPMDLDSDETSRDIDPAVLHRISIPFIWAEWFGLGSHQKKNNKMHVFEHVYFLYLGVFLHGSPGQTTLPIRKVSNFCAKPRSQSVQSFHQGPIP